MGSDALTLSDVILGDTAGGEAGSCNPVSSVGVNCEGATIDCCWSPPPTPLPPPYTDLTIAIVDAPDPVTVGGNVVYTVTVTNDGPNAVTATAATVTLPATKPYVSNDCGATEAGGVVSWAIGALAERRQRGV